jgi:hypothetical protein
MSLSFVTDSLSEKLQNARDALMSDDAKGIYLGSSGVLEKLTWERCGRADRIVTAETAALIREQHKAHASDPDAPVPPPPDAAILSAVIFIPEEDYWLTSCGMWKEPTIVAETFADVKPTCTGGTPEHPVFSGDFRKVLENVAGLIEKGRTQGVKAAKGVLVKSSTGLERIKFRHVLFEVC